MRITFGMLEDLISKASPELEEPVKPRYLELPPMSKQGKLRYVLYHHWRKGKSVSDRTPVIIKDKEESIYVVPICKLWHAAEGLTVWTGKGWSKIFEISRHKQEESIRRVNVYGGLVEVSEDHSLFRDGVPIKVDELREGESIDLIELPDLKFEDDVDKSYAWLWGFFLAEGWVTQKGEVRICNTKIELLRKAIVFLDKFGLDYNVSKNGTEYILNFNFPVFKKGCLQGVHEVKERRARWKIIPSFIFDWNRESLKAFIQGFLDGDGLHLTSNPKSWSFSSSSLTLAQGFFLLFKNLKPESEWTISSHGDFVDVIEVDPFHNKTEKRGKIRKIILAKSQNQEGAQNSNFKGGKFIRKIKGYQNEFFYNKNRLLYDLGTESHDFLAGVGAIKAHNSVHWDFRFELDGFLIGYTIMDNPVVPEDVESKEQAKEYSFSLPFHFKPVPGMDGLKCRVASKARQPKEWLFWKEDWGVCCAFSFDELWSKEVGEVIDYVDVDVDEVEKDVVQRGDKWCVVKHTTGEVIHCYSGGGAHEKALKLLRAIQAAKHRRLIGKIDVGEVVEFEPGTVGATRYGYGRLVMMDKGYISFGAQKVWYNEYFLNSIADSKYCFKKLRVNVRATTMPRTDPETKKPLPGKFEIVWNIWVPESQEPYAVGKRARDEGWVPPKGFIPLPEWWIKENGEAYEDWLGYARGKWEGKKELLKAAGKYVLSQMSWKGQVVIRDIPVLHWYLFLDSDGKVRLWMLRDNPLRDQPTTAGYLGEVERKWFGWEGLLEPGEFLNPEKRLEAEFRTLASGAAYFNVERVDGKEVVDLDFKGELEGHWVLEQEEKASKMYSFSRVEVGKEDSSGLFVLHKHSWNGHAHFDVRIDSGKKVLDEWSLKSDPRKWREEEGEEVYLKECADKSWLEAGLKGREKRMVGNVETYVELLERGEVEFIEESELFRSFRFKGEDFEGYYVLKSDGKVWKFMRSRLPEVGKADVEVEEKEDFIRVHLHDIRDFSVCEGAEKGKRYDIPELPVGVEANICLFPRTGIIHGARIQALTFDKKKGWSMDKVKSFNVSKYREWEGVQLRGVKSCGCPE